ncbi:1-phosphofructokinase family hexose kinase [Propionibacterium australiense]|uniref:1-PFK: hexose kinase, 1-phosphofructokinase family n=1 Tax=Propionibacterium australiense TaxID=119981 RepID=A0A383S8X7_9ACTN|nr:hexose kinase [Propionibacterium australiense]RLP07648.1 1-phosphofructokinase family hexose kinase [Propionibacterium australiense]RLP08073.1 1-phosphofructokinase family hexose kinase [Propionibacterium australiense]SYZ33726.1 1-PFK: hexose kinase, 1-phosphofructokinase family [Propionibacterium australiense]VEH92806.1 Tagatose-6-phosphate kinase [Propionibacterium australiense]
MITVITPNPALDVTYEVDEFLLHRTTRVRAVHERPGGKGVNVARVAAALGHHAEVSGFLGGRDGQAVAGLLTRIDPGIAQRWVPIDGATRRTVAVVDSQDTSMLNEPGPAVTTGDWVRQAAMLADGSGPVVVSGSMPPGSRSEDLSGVVAAARDAGRPIIVDTSGQLLHAAARAGADLLKPNRDELAAATGLDDPVAGARVLLDEGASAVVVSLGADGMLLLLAGYSIRWTAAPARVLSGNPTGAGDAAVAAFAVALDGAAGADRAEALVLALPNAVALSGAAVLSPVAGEVDLNAYREMLSRITVTENEHAH